MNNFQELDVWKKSVILIKRIYEITEQLPKSEEYNLKQQLKRAIVSVSLNIAEGKNRRTNKDFAHFVNIAIGSISETEAILVICEELNYCKIEEEIFLKVTELTKMLKGLHRTLVKNDSKS